MSKRILYVEDNPDLLSMVQHLVETNLPGTVVDVCITANGAERMLNTLCYDLVICDLKLPGELGTTIIEKILERDQDQPVMLMTAYHGDDIKGEVERIQSRFNRHIPLSLKFSDRSPAEFIEQVRQILSQDFCCGRPVPSQLTRGDRGELRFTSDTIKAARASLAA